MNFDKEIKDLGFINAEINWLTMKNGNAQLIQLLREQRKLLLHQLSSERDSMKCFFEIEDDKSVTNRIEHFQEMRESQIIKEFKPPNISCDSSAIQNRTTENIPEDILLGLSFGPRFIFPCELSENNCATFLALLEDTIDYTVDPIKIDWTQRNIAKQMDNMRFGHKNYTIFWLKFVKERINSFFKKHKDLMPIRADKGNMVAIVYKEDYRRAMATLVNPSQYDVVPVSPLHSLINDEIELINELKKCTKAKFLLTKVKYKTCTQLPKFYSLAKLHKPGDLKLRPITDTNSSPGKFISECLLVCLSECFPAGSLHVKNSFTFKKFLETVKVREGEVLVSFDVESMYTNISPQLAKFLIMKKKQMISDIFGIEPRLLLKMIDFSLNKAAVFLSNNVVYRIKSGIFMGSCISPKIAQILMDEVIKFATKNIEQHINYIKVYVDDTNVLLQETAVQTMFDKLNQFHENIKFTLERENAKQINFLNMTLIRSDDQVITNWYRKDFASKRILNYLSQHDEKVILATAVGFIKTVLSLSHESFFEENTKDIEKTLNLNNFPETEIMRMMNNEYTLMKPVYVKRSVPNVLYATFPGLTLDPLICKNIKNILASGANRPLRLATTTKNVIAPIFSNLKQRTPPEKRFNMIATGKCKCKQRTIIEPANFEELGSDVLKRVITEIDNCDSERHAFKKVKLIQGLNNYKRTRAYARCLRAKTQTKSCGSIIGWPNMHFARILKTKRNSAFDINRRFI